MWILTQFCLFIPKHLQSDIISEYHSDLGHLGIEKTCSAIHSKYYWLNLHKDVTDYVIKCVTCQLRSSQQPKPPIQELDISPFAFAQLELGHCSGPYHTSLSGNRYIISFIDLYSGCIEAFACPDKSAQTIAQLLIEEIFQRFSRPLELFTDNGSENVNQVMKETLAAMIIPRVTGMVERSHPTLISIFSKKIATEGNSWDRWLGFSLAAMRFGVNESTQQSPFFLLYNGEVVLTIDNILKSRRKYQGEEPHKIALEQQHKNFLLVHQNRTKAQKKRNERINKTRSSEVELKVGDPVYYRNHKPKSKLDIKWQPYYRIIEQTSPVTFILKHTLDGSTTKVHAEHLRYADLDEWEIPKDQTEKRLRPMVIRTRPRVKLSQFGLCKSQSHYGFLISYCC